jgi:hypothetical protein
MSAGQAEKARICPRPSRTFLLTAFIPKMQIAKAYAGDLGGHTGQKGPARTTRRRAKVRAAEGRNPAAKLSHWSRRI